MNEPDIPRNTLTIPNPYTLQDAEQFYDKDTSWQELNNLQKDWSIRDGESLIGGIGMMYNHGMDSHKTEIGYWLASSHRGRGIITECIRSFCATIFERTDIVRIEAHVFAHNVPSCRALEKAGFLKEGYLHKGFKKHDVYLDAWLYAFVKD